MQEGIPILDAKFYAEISEEDVKRVFRPDSGDEMPLMPERLAALREAGRALVKVTSLNFLLLSNFYFSPTELQWFICQLCKGSEKQCSKFASNHHRQLPSFS